MVDRLPTSPRRRWGDEPLLAPSVTDRLVDFAPPTSAPRRTGDVPPYPLITWSGRISTAAPRRNARVDRDALNDVDQLVRGSASGQRRTRALRQSPDAAAGPATAFALDLPYFMPNPNILRLNRFPNVDNVTELALSTVRSLPIVRSHRTIRRSIRPRRGCRGSGRK